MQSGTFHGLNLVTGKPLSVPIKHGDDFITAAATPDGKLLALGLQDGRLELWNPPLLPAPPQLPAKLEAAKLNELWDALAGGDAKAAYDARWQLAAASKQTLPLFAGKLEPVRPVDAKQVASWVAQLDSQSFKERESAMRELTRAESLVEGELRRALEQKPTLEVRLRVEQILSKLNLPAGEPLRTLRSVVILETIGTKEAHEILRSLADGAPGARVTQAAQGALKRMGAGR